MTTTRTTGNVVVQMIGCSGGCEVFSAWEPTRIMGGHSTLTTFPDHSGWYGRIGTRPLPGILAAMPALSLERSAAVGSWHDAQYQEAYREIRRAFPMVDAGGTVREIMGEIEVYPRR